MKCCQFSSSNIVRMLQNYQCNKCPPHSMNVATLLCKIKFLLFMAHCQNGRDAGKQAWL